MADRHVRGPSRARKHARLETRPTSGPTDSAGGYERIRSTERRDDDPRDHAVDVYAAHHRLLAVAWNVARAETGAPILPDGYEGVVDMGALVGDDVHHDAPEADAERGIPWDNREACLVVEDHGAHAGLTNAERRAYARDGQRLRDGDATLATGGCATCDAEETAATFDGDDREYCIDCASEQADGRTVRML
jgi:hypothetical protein